MKLEDEVLRRDLSERYVTEFEDLMGRVEGEVEAAAASYDLAVELEEATEFFKEGEKEVSKRGDLPNPTVTLYRTPYEADHQEVVGLFQDMREDRDMPTDPHKLVPEIAEELKMNPDVLAHAHKYLDEASTNNRTFLNGMEEGIAGAAIYFAAITRNQKTTQKEVAEVADVSTATLRSYYEDILESR